MSSSGTDIDFLPKYTVANVVSDVTGILTVGLIAGALVKPAESRVVAMAKAA